MGLLPRFYWLWVRLETLSLQTQSQFIETFSITIAGTREFARIELLNKEK